MDTDGGPKGTCHSPLILSYTCHNGFRAMVSCSSAATIEALFFHTFEFVIIAIALSI